MSFSIDMPALRERALKRVAATATVAILPPDEGRKIATDAGLQCTTERGARADCWCWPHSEAMNTAELKVFAVRRDRLLRWGYAEREADALADRLTLRDRDGDDRRLCSECSWLGDAGRCLAAAGGRILGVDRRLEPVQTILQRCVAFDLRDGPV